MIAEEWLSLAREQADRFWSKVDKSGDCWLWTAGKDKDGYGKFQINAKGWRNGRPVQKHVRAHKIAWEMANGALPDDLLIRHSCDTPACVNMLHMSHGTTVQNVADRQARNRSARGDRSGPRLHPERMPRGERHHNATITEDTVRVIRKMSSDGMASVRIAMELSVGKGVVYQVVGRRTWKDVV